MPKQQELGTAMMLKLSLCVAGLLEVILASHIKLAHTGWSVSADQDSALIKRLVHMESPPKREQSSSFVSDKSILEKPSWESSSSLRQCLEDMDTYVRALNQTAYWAVQMRDATGAPGKGLPAEDQDVVGVTSECYSVQPPPPLSLNIKYCSLTFDTPLAERMAILIAPFPITSQSVGLCVPASCDPDDVRIFFQQNGTTINLTSEFNVSSVYCQQNSGPLKLWPIILLVVLSCWVCLLLLATCYDAFYSGRVSQQHHQGQHDRSKKLQEGQRRATFAPNTLDDLEAEFTTTYVQPTPPLRPLPVRYYRRQGASPEHPGHVRWGDFGPQQHARPQVVRKESARRPVTPEPPGSAPRDLPPTYTPESSDAEEWLPVVSKSSPDDENILAERSPPLAGRRATTSHQLPSQPRGSLPVPLPPPPPRPPPPPPYLPLIHAASRLSPFTPVSSDADEEDDEEVREDRGVRRPCQAHHSDDESSVISFASLPRADDEDYLSCASVKSHREAKQLSKPPEGDKEAGDLGLPEAKRGNGILKSHDLRVEGHETDKTASKIYALAKCLSLSFNFKLLGTHQPEAQLAFLHGLRACACIWIVCTNTVLYVAPYMRNSLSFVEDESHLLVFSVFASGSFSVDVLLVVSGVLVGFVTSKKLEEKGGKVNWFCFLFRHYWRLTPSMVLVGVAYLTFFPVLTNGPLWTDQAPDYSECKRYGWMNALLLQNFLQQGCMPWTWYQAVDWQLYALSPLVFFLLRKCPISCAFLPVCLVFLPVVVCGVVSHVFHLPLVPYAPSANITQGADFNAVYLKQPYTHAPSYFGALLAGYLLYKTRGRSPLKLVPTVVTSAVCAAAGLAVVFGPVGYLRGNVSPSTSSAAAYNALSHTVYSASVCWLVFLWARGNLRPINQFLSWRGWLPVSRMTYCIYLVHPVVIFCYTACLEQLPYLTIYFVVILQLGMLVITTALAMVVAVCIEMPLSNMEAALSSSWTQCVLWD